MKRNKRKVLLLCFMLLTFIATSQVDTLNLSKLTGSEYVKILNSQFSKVVTGQNNNSLGNFASVDIVDSKVAFAPSIFFPNGNILTAEIDAGISDGITSVFSNSTFNSNIGAKINYHFLYKDKNSVSIRDIKNTKLLERKLGEHRKKEIGRIDNGERIESLDYQIDKLESEIFNNQLLIEKESKDNSELRIKSYELKIKILNAQISEKKKELDALPNNNERESKEDELNDEINKKKIEIIDWKDKKSKETQSNIKSSRLAYENELLQKKIDSLDKVRTEFDSEYEKFLVNTEYRKKAKEIFDKYEVTGISLGWFSIFYEVNSNEFKRLNSELEFNSQIIEEDFVSHGFGIQFSWLNLDTSEDFKSFFWSNGLDFSYSDNFNDLTKQEISETNQLGESSGQRAITNKFNAYSGEYQDDIRSLNFFSDFYYFIFHNNRAAVHLNPVYQIIEDTKPRFNLELGLLFSFKNSKENKETPIVNAEVYYNFLDLFKTTETDLKLFERNDIGLRFTFPINFNIKTK